MMNQRHSNPLVHLSRLRARWLAVFCLIGLGLGTVVNACTLAEIQQSGSLRLCVAGSSAAFYQANGEALAKFLGLAPEVIALKEWDLQFQNSAGVVVKEASYVAQPLANGQCDVFPNDLHALDWRASKMDLVPYYTTRKVVVAHRDQRSLHEVADLKGHNAAVQKGTAYDAWLKEQNQTTFSHQPVRISYAPTAEAMVAVANKSADFTVVGAEASFKWVRGDLDNLDILFPVDAPVGVAWGIHPKAQGLRPRIEQFFKESARVGSALDHSWRKQYGISLMEYQLFDAAYAAAGFDFKKLLAWMLPIGVGLLSVLIAGLVWMRRLNREIAERKAAQAHSAEVTALVEQREQLNAQVATIFLNLQGVGSYGDLSKIFFFSVAPLLALGQGSFYRVDAKRDRLLLCGGYARTGEVGPAADVDFGSGLLGQCALELKTLVIHHPPTDYLAIQFGLGLVQPASIALIPIISQSTLLGVIELACLTPFNSQGRALIDRLMPVIALSLEIIARNDSTQSLLLAAQGQAHASSA